MVFLYRRVVFVGVEQFFDDLDFFAILNKDFVEFVHHDLVAESEQKNGF